MRIAIALIALGAIARAEEPQTMLAHAEFLLGSQAYDAGRWREAAKHFRRSYEAEPRTALLYNEAQSWRCDFEASGDRESAQRAVALYRQYVASPELSEAERVESLRWIAALERQLARPQVAPVAAPAAAAPALVVATPAPDHPRRRTGLWIGLAIGAAAVVALGVGLGVGLGTAHGGGAPTFTPRW